MDINDLFDNNSPRKTFRCETCGEPFWRYQSQVKRRNPRFCCKECRKNGQWFDCSECGEKVYKAKNQIELRQAAKGTHDTPQRGATFCSPECRNRFDKRTNIDLRCLNCGEDFVRRQSQIKRPGRGQFCSRECSDTFGLETVCCSWPECTETMVARRFDMPKRGLAWKLDLTKKGQAYRWPLCQYHSSFADKYLPKGHRLRNGKQKWFRDPSLDLGTRGVTATVTKLIIWSKTDGCCGSCGTSLDFFEKPRQWHIDHKKPVFKGGTTNYWNLEPLCGECHGRKSSKEKSEASRARHRENKARRWLTHPEKDELIVSLRQEIASLRDEIVLLKEVDNASKNIGGRVSVPKKGLRKVRRYVDEGRQGSLFMES